MSDLFLIAHKVHSMPAFDVACRMPCPECVDSAKPECVECDSEGFWWIVPTSGHRAYPFWSIPLDALMHDTDESVNEIDPVRTLDEVPEMPASTPDHYAHKSAPSVSLSEALNLKKPKVTLVERRI